MAEINSTPRMPRLNLVHRSQAPTHLLPIAGEKIRKGQLTLMLGDGKVYPRNQGTLLGIAEHDAEPGQPIAVKPDVNSNQRWILSAW
jgi:hypothetical protein